MARDEGYMLLKQTEFPVNPGGKHVRSLKERAIISIIIVLGVLLLSLGWILSPGVLNLFGLKHDTSQEDIASPSLEHLGSSEPLKQCAASNPPPATPPAPVNLWASLTVPETVAVTDWLSEPSRNLNLTAGDRAQLPDNFIFHIEVYRPSKAAALEYLASPTEDKLPQRYARVTIHHGAIKAEDGGPVIKDYLVGPLPIGKTTKMRELTEIYHRDDIPFNARMFAIPTELTPLLMKIMPPLAEVTQVCYYTVALCFSPPC